MVSPVPLKQAAAPRARAKGVASQLQITPYLNWWLWICLAALYLPIIIMVVFSFNDSKRGVVWRGFSLRHYEAAWKNHDLLDAFGNSLIVASGTALISTALGLCAALTLERIRIRSISVYRPVLLIPLVIPEVCLGVALLVFFHMIGWHRSWPWPLALCQVLAAHVTFSLPFCTLLIRARLRQLNSKLEVAARDLGATQLRAIWDVTVPLLKPALLASILMAFTLSLDDFVVSFFTATPEAQLLPVRVFSMIRFGATPQVNAVSTILLLITVVSILFAALAYQRK